MNRPELTTFGILLALGQSTTANPARAEALQDVQTQAALLEQWIEVQARQQRAERRFTGDSLLGVGAAGLGFGIALLATARARAAIDGRDYVLPDDVKRMVAPVMRHRLILTPEAELEGVSAERVLERIVERIEVPRE